MERREFQDTLSLQSDEYESEYRDTVIAVNNTSRGSPTPVCWRLITQLKLLAQELALARPTCVVARRLSVQRWLLMR